LANRRRNNSDWRDFEDLVSRIEATLVPKGAIVRSPDRLRSLLTNRLREVYASIKIKLGTTNVVVTVECRKRKASQDVTWLEQLSSKKQALGVARTIAVSSSEFSSDAVKAAKYYGIDLRVVRDITTADIETWPFPQSMIHVYKSSELLGPPEVEFKLLQGESAAAYANQGGESTRSKHDANAAIFFRPSVGDYLTLSDLWNMADRKLGIYDKLSWSAGPVRVDLTIEVPEDLQVHTALGLRDVHRIRLKTAICWKQETLTLAGGSIVTYSNAVDPSSPTIARLELETQEASKNNLRIGLQMEEGSNQMRFSVQLLDRNLENG
jgi:hypothetical protein